MGVIRLDMRRARSGRAVFEAADGERRSPMDFDGTLARFRAHATARLRGDAAGAARLVRGFTAEQRRSHLLFVQALFAAVVVDRLGSRPDPQDLADFTKLLHDRHFAADSGFNALHAEAMIRVLFDEAHLLFEVPQSEQPAYLWAVMDALVEPGVSDAELAPLLCEAEALTVVEDEAG